MPGQKKGGIQGSPPRQSLPLFALLSWRGLWRPGTALIVLSAQLDSSGEPGSRQQALGTLAWLTQILLLVNLAYCSTADNPTSEKRIL